MSQDLDAAKPSRFEWIVAVSAACLALFFSCLDLLLHPGAAFPDELTQIQWLQEHQEGLALPLSLAKGCLQRWLLVLPGRGHSITLLHLPALAAFVGECLLLYLLGRRLFSKRAGLWAVATAALASFTFLRLRSLLSYSVFPFELLLLIYLLLSVRRAWVSFVVGFIASLLLLDYEAWIFGLAVLGLVRLQDSPALKTWLAGLSLGLLVVLWLSWGELASYAAVRQSQSLPHSFFELAQQGVAGLRGYWLGGPTLAYTGVRETPAFPIWAWPALLAGILGLASGQRWLLLWIALGFLPLLSKNSSVEPQRAILAWPALCLLAGAGVDRLQASRRWAMPAIVLLAAAGAAYEARAYISAMAAAYGPVYGASDSVLKISTGRSAQILTEFDNESSAAWRFLLPVTPKAGLAGERLALLPRPYCLEKNNLKGVWLEVPENGPCLLKPDQKTWERLSRVDVELRALWRALPREDLFGRRQGALRYYLEHPQADPWVKTACLEQVFGMSFLLGEVPLDLLKKVERENLSSASLLLWCANKLRAFDPAWSQRLLKRAHALDPSRGLP
jgi:hypothetical protein